MNFESIADFLKEHGEQGVVEVLKIMNLQAEALQEGILEVKKADEIKSNFLANVSHELRTPLNSIIGFSDLLAQERAGALNEKQKDYVNDIRAAGLTLLGMINGILDISKIEAGALKLNLSAFSVKTAVEEVLNIIFPLADKRGLEIELQVEDIEITADYQKFQQILFNLLSNAVKFAQSRIVVGFKQDTLTVRDDGPGIAPTYQKKIFNKFESTNSTGLGLAIVKEFVNLHKGTVNVESEPKNGATFRLLFPQGML
ncbi:MAG: HAMP domain-containing histidine kinase [Heliobacteriaceae bacterium]|jgi:signal transduction histidine kinase|nr:HAMP domain-containing histidine kinase [Heliobacteriaceae bacterium]